MRCQETYKVTGIAPGPTAFQLGNCLTMRKSRDVVNTPVMYAKVRGSMNTPGTIDNLSFFEELFKSDVVLDYQVSEPRQQGDVMEGAVLVVALLIAFPNARFGLGLPGGDSVLGPSDHYRSLGATSIDLSEASGDRFFLTQLFNYLRSHSYYVDDDLVHILALLTDLCHDRDRTIPAQVLSLSTSGNHQVDAGLFHAYQLIEALLETGNNHELLRDAVARWNGSYDLQLNADEIDFIRNLRDISLHFKAPRAETRLKDSQIALGFDRDRSRQHEFRQHGMQKLLRKAARAYFSARLQLAHALDVCKT